MIERTGLLQVGGNDVTIVGPDVKVGDVAPEFNAHSQNWDRVDILKSTSGKVRIIAAVPSLETDVCDKETRRFNEEASSLSEDIVIVTISADLPFTQKRWCGAAGIDRLLVVSDHYDANFGEKYGSLIKERRVLRRAVFVIDKFDKVVYVDYMEALGDEPNYQQVLEAARNAL